MNYNDYKGGYTGRYENYRPIRHMVVDEKATKEAAYQELEEMAHEMLKFMDANGIDIFEMEIRSPQRNRAWRLEATGKDHPDTLAMNLRNDL